MTTSLSSSDRGSTRMLTSGHKRSSCWRHHGNTNFLQPPFCCAPSKPTSVLTFWLLLLVTLSEASNATDLESGPRPAVIDTEMVLISSCCGWCKALYTLCGPLLFSQGWFSLPATSSVLSLLGSDSVCVSVCLYQCKVEGHLHLNDKYGSVSW